MRNLIICLIFVALPVTAGLLKVVCFPEKVLAMSKNNTIEKLYVIDNPLDKISLSDSVYSEILRLNLEHPEIVYAQVTLETGHFTSELFESNNNMFGMRRSGSRVTTSNKIENGYKWYPSWRESLLDYAFLQSSFYRGKTKEEYFNKLSRSYAEDPKYVVKLKKIIER